MSNASANNRRTARKLALAAQAYRELPVIGGRAYGGKMVGQNKPIVDNRFQPSGNGRFAPLSPEYSAWKNGHVVRGKPGKDNVVVTNKEIGRFGQLVATGTGAGNIRDFAKSSLGINLSAAEAKEFETYGKTARTKYTGSQRGGAAAHYKAQTKRINAYARQKIINKLAAAGRLPILVLTGKLRRAVSSKNATVTPTGDDRAIVRFTNLPEYAEHLQSGTAKMPARSPVDPNAKDMEMVREVMLRHLRMRIGQLSSSTSFGGGAPRTA